MDFFLYVPIIYTSILILLKHASKFTFSICTVMLFKFVFRRLTNRKTFDTTHTWILFILLYEIVLSTVLCYSSCQGSGEAESEKTYEGCRGMVPRKIMISRSIVVCFWDSFSHFLNQNFNRLVWFFQLFTRTFQIKESGS